MPAPAARALGSCSQPCLGRTRNDWRLLAAPRDAMPALQRIKHTSVTQTSLDLRKREGSVSLSWAEKANATNSFDYPPPTRRRQARLPHASQETAPAMCIQHARIRDGPWAACAWFARRGARRVMHRTSSQSADVAVSLSFSSNLLHSVAKRAPGPRGRMDDREAKPRSAKSAASTITLARISAVSSLTLWSFFIFFTQQQQYEPPAKEVEAFREACARRATESARKTRLAAQPIPDDIRKLEETRKLEEATMRFVARPIHYSFGIIPCFS